MQSKTFHSWLFRLALAVNIGLAISLVLLGVAAIQQDLLWRADFTAFYTGGAIVRDGLGKQLYDYLLQKSYQQEILGGKSFYQGLLPFNYPPHVALIFAPLAHFSRPVAFGIVLFIQIGLFIWLLKSLQRLAENWQRSEKILLFSGVFGFFPLLSNMLLGAFSLFVLDCMLSWYLALRRHRQVASGLWLVVAAVKPQAVVIPGISFLLMRCWKGILAAALASLGLVIFVATSLGVSIWADFIQVLQLSSSFFDEYGIYPSAMYNLKGTLAIWLGNSHATFINTVSLLGFLASIGVTIWLWRERRQPDQPDFALRLAFTLTLGVFLGMHVNPQDSLLLIMPAVLFYDYLRREGLPRQAYGIFLWACLPLFMLSEFTVQERLGIRLPVVAIMILLGWLGKALWSRR